MFGSDFLANLWCVVTFDPGPLMNSHQPSLWDPFSMKHPAPLQPPPFFSASSPSSLPLPSASAIRNFSWRAVICTTGVAVKNSSTKSMVLYQITNFPNPSESCRKHAWLPPESSGSKTLWKSITRWLCSTRGFVKMVHLSQNNVDIFSLPLPPKKKNHQSEVTVHCCPFFFEASNLLQILDAF